MKKLLLIIFLLIPFNAISAEKTKEEKVAKYVLENIQKDYVNCYSFYKVAAQSFKDAGKDKSIIEKYTVFYAFTKTDDVWKMYAISDVILD